MMDRAYFLSRASEAIEDADMVCFDVAAEHGQMFGNVKHMTWFVEAVADELEGEFSIDGEDQC